MADAKIMGMPRKTAIIFGIGGVAAIGALLWYRHRQAAGAGTAAAPATADTSVDPATGYPYGSAEDQAALAAQNGYGDPALAGAGVISGSGSGGTVGATGAQGPAGPQGPGLPVPVHTNAEWAQQAEDHLGGGASVSAALHKYISGGAMTPDQEQAAGFAISWLGYPPQRGAQGFPPAMRTQPNPGHKPGKHTIISNGNEDLHSYAMHNGITEKQIILWNPALRKYAGTGKHIPKGIKIVV